MNVRNYVSKVFDVSNLVSMRKLENCGKPKIDIMHDCLLTTDNKNELW